MLLLTCSNRGGSSYLLTAGKLHVVSRTTGDIILAEDQSVSRKHAVFEVIPCGEGGDSFEVAVTDMGSKYGTYVNESNKLEANKPFLLKDGDIIKFGCQWNEWRLNSQSLVVTTSTLSSEIKLSLKTLITELGGTLVNDWQENCSHLTMVNILLTAKVVSALASAVPIVTPEYWTCFKKAIEHKELPPNPEEFVPPLKEVILNKNKVSFSINKKRRKIFVGKTFVFSSEKQMRKYRVLINAAGGKSIIFGECNWKLEEFCDPDIIVMQNLSDDTQYTQVNGQYNQVISLLKSKGKRPIPESELGLAILMCSLEMYCNPQYNVSNLLLGGSEVSMSQLKTEEVLVADTPSMIGDVSVKLERSFEENRPMKKEFHMKEEIPNHEMSAIDIFEMETIPFEDQGKILEPKTTNQENELRSGVDSSRKRAADNYSESPSSKKQLLEKDPLDDLLSETQCGAFNFMDICAAKSSWEVGNNQSRKDLVNNNRDKREQIYSDKIILNHELKSCLEDQFSSNQAKPGPIKVFDNNHTAERKQCTITEMGNFNKSDRSLIKEINLFHKDTILRESDSKSRKKRAASVLDESNDEPSTSKEWNNGDIFLKKETKKAKWNQGMASGILDMVVKVEELIIEKPTQTSSNVPQHKVNFKKFKKVRPTTFKYDLPEIIGESDLICDKM